MPACGGRCSAGSGGCGVGEGAALGGARPLLKPSRFLPTPGPPFPWPGPASLAGEADQADQPQRGPQPPRGAAAGDRRLRGAQRSLPEGQPPGCPAARARPHGGVARAGRGREPVSACLPCPAPADRPCPPAAGALTVPTGRQAAESAVRAHAPQPQGPLAGREPGPADAPVPDGGRRSDRREGAHVLPVAPAAPAQPR